MGVNRFRANLKEVEFTLFESHQLSRVLGKGTYANWGEEEVKMVLAEAYRYATEVAGPLNREGDQHGARLVDGKVITPPGFKAAFDQLLSGGFKSLTAPEAYGGADAPKSLASMVTELTTGANTSLDMYGGLSFGAAELLLHFATEEQKQTYAVPLLAGTWAGTMCLTEPHAGSDLALVSTSAKLGEDGRYRLKGTKIFISGGEQDITDNIVHLVLARIEGDAEGTKGLSLFIVPKKRVEDGSSNDVSCTSIEHKMGIRASSTCVLNFGDNGDCQGELVGGVSGAGIKQMFKMMNFARIGVGVQGLGIASSAYLNAVDYAKERKQGTSLNAADSQERVAIIEHADVRRMLLDMKCRVEGMRALVVATTLHHDLAEVTEDPEEKKHHLGQVELLTPIVKSYCSDQGFRVCETAIQVFGGAGFTADHPVEQDCRDSKIFSIYEGTNYIQAMDLLGRKLPMAQGALVQGWLTAIVQSEKQADATLAETPDPHLERGLATFRTARKALAQSLPGLSGWAMTGRMDLVTLYATRIADVFAKVAVAHLLLASALAAKKADPNYYGQALIDGKSLVFSHFSATQLSTVPAELVQYLSGDNSALEMSEEAFS